MTDSSVQRQTFRVTLKDGLHLRPYSMIAKCANDFTSDVKMLVHDLVLNAKSPLDLMTLGADRAAYGTEVTLEATGTDAREAVEAIGKLFETGFPIDESTAS